MEVAGCGVREVPCGGVAGEQFEDPSGGDVLDADGEFGEAAGEELVELVDESGALSGDGLESSGDLSQREQFE